MSEAKEEMILLIWKKLEELVDNYTWEAYQEIEGLIGKWNSEHYNTSEEIFFCEHTNENNEVDGYCLEDDSITF